MGKKGRKFIFLILASLVLIFLGTEMTYARDFDLTPRSNGTVWIEFGTGIIDSCRSIQLIDHGRIYNIEFGKKEFELTKLWIRSRFDSKLNTSPTVPCNKAIEPSTICKLFSTSLVPSSSSSSHPAARPSSRDKVRAGEDEGAISNALLVSFPIAPEILGISKEQFVLEYEKLLSAAGIHEKGHN